MVKGPFIPPIVPNLNGRVKLADDSTQGVCVIKLVGIVVTGFVVAAPTWMANILKFAPFKALVV
jgi:hypothetical protein